TSEGSQEIRSHDATGPVSRIDHDQRIPLSNGLRIDFRADPFHVTRDRGVVRPAGPDVGPGCGMKSVLEVNRFNHFLVLATHLHTAGADRLESVELPRIVGGRDDDRPLEMPGLRDEVLGARRGDRAQVDDVTSGGHEARGGGPGEHRPAQPRIPSESDRAALEERPDRAADLHGEIRVHRLANDPADAARAEETGHAATRSSRTSPWGGTCTPSSRMLSRTWAPSPIAAPAPMIEDAISTLSSTLTPSRSVAFTTDARPTLQDLPRTTSGPSRP